MIAKNGLSNIILQDYSGALSQRRVIKTGLINIQSIIVGKREKILYVADRNSSLIAEYQILESECSLDNSRVACSSIHLNKEVKCREQNRIWI